MGLRTSSRRTFWSSLVNASSRTWNHTPSKTTIAPVFSPYMLSKSWLNMSLHSTVNIDSATRLALTCRDGRGVSPLNDHSETPWGASIEQKLAALKSDTHLIEYTQPCPR